MNQPLESVEIGFVSGGLPKGTLRLLGVRGREWISRLFSFDLLLERKEGPLSDDELDALVRAPCAVAMGPTPGDVVRGIVRYVRVLDAARDNPSRYRIEMVPTAYVLTLGQSNRIFQATTVPQMVTTILQQYGLSAGKDFEILVSGSPPEREYIVQYQESDWDFIQRWLEHEGFFYWFEHGGAADKLIIADANADTTPIAGPSAISYRERNNLSTGRIATVWDWELEQQRIPARVTVIDYNYRRPDVRLVAKATVDEARGFGTVMSSGEHVKSVEEGNTVAAVRAQRFLCERRTYTARTDCARFRAGHSFELENHHDAANDGKYLITSIEHTVGHRFVDDPEPSELAHRYLARFSAMPFDVAFRPARVTPWPSIHGVLHAHVESDTSGEFAQIDDQGRYKVRLPFDSGDAKGTQASRWIRMAQPYAGAGYGSHFPLHKGTEVLLAHVDGDPDRPIIVGAVPNVHTMSPSTSANATQSVISTASGIRIEMEDFQKA
jgi:type VI secretion system secreted protein VgrG